MNKTADAVIFYFDKNIIEVLLITRKNSPFKGDYAFPGGFLNIDEDPLAACVRELYEETDILLDSNDAIQLSIRKKVGRDPRGPTQTHPYLFLLDKKCSIKAKDDATSVEWVSLNNIDKLAFDHGAILCEALGRLWPYMPDYIGKENREVKDIVFFGGCFNPWHKGHEECIRLFLVQNPEKLLVVLPDTSPWKGNENCGDYFSFFRELEKKLSHYDLQIYPGFWGKEEANATIDWFPRVMARRKGLLVGDDQFSSLRKWKNSQELLDCMDFLFVVPRNLDDNKRKKTEEEIQTLAPELEIKILSDHEYRHLSSTEIRKQNEKV